MYKRKDTNQIPKDSKIYISIPITGVPKDLVEQQVSEVKTMLDTKECVSLNPLDIPDGPDWYYFMRESVKLLADADIIYMMPGWRESRGCILERYLAMRLNIPVMYDEKVNEYDDN